MSVACRLFGHRTLPYGNQPWDAAYGRAAFYTIDNLGTEHWEVFGECSRCGANYRMARFHGPLKLPAHIAAMGAERRGELRARRERAEAPRTTTAG